MNCAWCGALLDWELTAPAGSDCSAPAAEDCYDLELRAQWRTWIEERVDALKQLE